MHLISLSYQPATALHVTVLRWELKGCWQFYHTPFYSQRLLILKPVLCFKSGIYWLTVRPGMAHRGLRWGVHYGIRTVKHWNRSSLSPAAAAVASSFSKLLILLLAHLEALLPSGKSNSTVHATRLVAEDQWHSWDGTGSYTPAPTYWKYGGDLSCKKAEHRMRWCFWYPPCTLLANSGYQILACLYGMFFKETVEREVLQVLVLALPL